MAGKKTVTPGHTVETGADVTGTDVTGTDVTGTALDALAENEGAVYEPGMAPEAKKDAPEGATPEGAASDLSPAVPQASSEDLKDMDPDTSAPENKEPTEDDQDLLVLVALKKGTTYRFKGKVFKKDEATAVEPEIAERLVATGFFERAAVSIERG